MNQIDISFSTPQLHALDRLLESRSVTRTGHDLGLTQSAVSHTLMALRQHFGDELLVRVGRAMTLTPFAERLRDPVRSVLRQIEDVSRLRDRFDPSRMTRNCVIASRDLALSLFGPSLVRRFIETAPLATLRVMPWETGLVAEHLASGVCDLAIGVDPPSTEGGLRIQKLFEDDYVVVCARKGAPRKGLSVDDLVSRPGLVVTRTDKLTSPVDLALASRGLKRRVAMRSAYFMAALSIVADSDLLMVVPRSLAGKHAEDFNLAVFEMPLALPRFGVYCVGHERFANSPLHKWLRVLVSESVGGALNKTDRGVKRPSG